MNIINDVRPFEEEVGKLKAMLKDAHANADRLMDSMKKKMGPQPDRQSMMKRFEECEEQDAEFAEMNEEVKNLLCYASNLQERIDKAYSQE